MSYTLRIHQVIYPPFSMMLLSAKLFSRKVLVCTCVCVCVCVCDAEVFITNSSWRVASLQWSGKCIKDYKPMYMYASLDQAAFSETRKSVRSERRGRIATAPPLRRSELICSRRNVSGGRFLQSDTNLANHRRRTKLLTHCQ